MVVQRVLIPLVGVRFPVPLPNEKIYNYLNILFSNKLYII